MQRILAFFSSTIGQKFLVGISGLGLAGFCLTHMAGNLLLLVSSDAYNMYSFKLITNPLILVAEIGLIAMLLMHVGLVVKLSIGNQSARGDRSRSESASGVKRTSFVAKTLILSGLLILAFVILHLLTFKFGTEYTTTVDGIQMRDLYKLVNEKFHEPIYVGWYLFSLLILWAHLSHGVSASFQSLGILSNKNCTLRLIGRAFSTLVILGFMAQPLYLYFRG